jgi:tetratricopeptide (TPR) repeat protein
MSRRHPASGRNTASGTDRDRGSKLAAVPGIAIWVLLFCWTLAAYWPSLQGGLVWDDDGHLTKPELQSLHGLWRIWFDLGATQQYYPLVHSLFWMEYRLWGDAVLGYHLTNVLLHALAACLLVAVLKRLEMKAAWLAGFVFALHPVSVETAAWISEQKNTLSAVFYFAAALVYLRFDRTRERSRYLLASALFALALLSKTVTATLPAALLVVFWWKRGTLSWKRDVLPLVPWLSIGAAAGLFTSWVERTFIGAQGADFALTAAQRVLIAGRALWFYAAKLIWPTNLMFSYPRWNIDAGDWRQCLFPAGILAVGIGLWLVSRRNRGPLAGFLIFAGTLFPMLGFLNVYPFRYSWVADHFQYLASVGIIVPVTSGMFALAARLRWNRLPQAACASVLLLILTALTWKQSATYANAETLYRDVLSKNPGSWMAHNGLGNVLMQTPGGVPEAMVEYETAERLRPGVAEPHLNRGLALLRSDPKRLLDAMEEYLAALEINPRWAEAYVNLGNAFAHLPGHMPDAIADYQTALRLKPHLVEAHNGLGNAFAQTGKPAHAVDEYEAALRINPDYVDAHINLGSTLAQIPGRRPEAIAQYEAALRIQPDLEPVRKALEQLRAERP